MKRQVPPLNFLRPFEATARLGSTVRAAEELGVTHSAVSRQVILLERWLDIKLFQRNNGRLTLTEEGAQFKEAVGHILNLLESTTRSLIGDGDENVVRLCSTGVFVSQWLIPRISKFYQCYPHLDMWISEFSRTVEPGRMVCDVAISMEPGLWPDMESIALMPDYIFPVCDTRLAAQITDCSKLLKHKRLHSGDAIAQWRPWLRAVGMPVEDDEVGARIADPGLILPYAASGHGVALARGQLVMEELASKELVRPLRHALKVNEAYWLIKPKYGRISSATRAFTCWIREEAELSSRRLFQQLSSTVLPYSPSGIKLDSIDGPGWKRSDSTAPQDRLPLHRPTVEFSHSSAPCAQMI